MTKVICTKSPKYGQNHKNTGVIRAIFHKCPYIWALRYLYGSWKYLESDQTNLKVPKRPRRASNYLEVPQNTHSTWKYLEVPQCVILNHVSSWSMQLAQNSVRAALKYQKHKVTRIR